MTAIVNLLDLSGKVVLESVMNDFPSLMRLRPARTDLYRIIILAVGLDRTRARYSFAYDYRLLGANTLWIRPGLVVCLPGLDNRFLINDAAYGIDMTVQYNINPINTYVDDATFIADFIAANPSFALPAQVDRVQVAPNSWILLPHVA